MIIETDEYRADFFAPIQEAVTVLDGRVRLSSGELILIGARPGMGKTSLALHMALEYTGKSDRSVYILSQDQGAVPLYEHLAGTLAEVDTCHIRERRFTEDDRNRLTEALDRLKSMRLVIDDTSLGERQILDRLETPDACGLALLDLSPQAERELSSCFFSELKYLSRRKRMAIIVTVTLDRSLEKRRDKRPTLRDLGRRGFAAEEADTVLLLYRKGYYEGCSQEGERAEILLAKNKNGTSDTVFLEWRGRYRRFGLPVGKDGV